MAMHSKLYWFQYETLSRLCIHASILFLSLKQCPTHVENILKTASLVEELAADTEKQTSSHTVIDDMIETDNATC